MSEQDLTGVRAIVTGSTRGLGAGVARALARDGASVVVSGTRPEACHALARELGGAAVPGSVADEAVAERLVETCVEAYGGVDFVVNNAGVTRDGTITRLAPEAFDEVIATHLRGAWLVSRAAVRAMRGTGGSIVNIVSGTALYGNVGQSNYAAAKGGILAMTRALSLELARYRIRVNAVSPVARTEMVEPLLALAPEREELPGCFGAPDEVAAAIVYFATPASAELTGQVIGFDGRRLTLWSHPAVIRAEERPEAWSPTDIHSAINGGERSELAPDRLGLIVRELTGVAPAH